MASFFFFLLYSSAIKLFGCEPASMTHTSISANFHMMDSAARISGIKQIMVGLRGCFCSFVFFVFFTNHYKCTRYRYKKQTAESRQDGPAPNCTSFARIITNKYRHATGTNI